MSIPYSNDQVLLLDMQNSAKFIQHTTEDIELEAFIGNRLFRGGILHELTIIGEAANGLTPEIRARHPEVPWRDIINFRNYIVHGYSGLTWERVWETVTLNVPELVEQVTAILTTEFPEADLR